MKDSDFAGYAEVLNEEIEAQLHYLVQYGYQIASRFL
jgi:hypothetical protein